MPDVFVAVGSNIDPENKVAGACLQLERIFEEMWFSPWYRNPAVGFEGEDFINCVVGFTTSMPVHEIMAHLHRIEKMYGRPRDAPKWAPRALDLDILLYGELVCDEPRLKLPRPDLLKRAYMLGPLADIAPHLRHPTAGATIGELWERFDRAAHPMQRLDRVEALATTQRFVRRPPPEPGQ